MDQFTYRSTSPSRVVFGSGTLDQLSDEVARLEGSRVLLISSERYRDVAESALGDLLAASFTGAQMHTPIEVTAEALTVATEHRIDTVVAVGGGSAMGLSKALASRANYPQIFVPTTYSGSEATAILGETDAGVKTTRSGPEIMADTVVYDVDLTLTMPMELTVVSSVNALAHAVEAMYAVDHNPAMNAIASEGVLRISRGLRGVKPTPTDPAPRADLLSGAWLAGMSLANTGMGLHHKLCHVLGGSFGLPHAPTHTVVLPQVMAYNASGAPAAMAAVANALGVDDAPSGLFDLIVDLNGPTSLAEFGFTRDDIPRAVEVSMRQHYPNPVEITEEGLVKVLTAAVAGTPPST
ncbi:MAG: maleylacetate reductase [Gordonia sp. (in: high G+C Gram-positive bacteria)]|uniref:maleylacetate reductase n=1 Tax=Gordonia sp. (in: high G+C Gram-positive bacteria) TaxID=84139 RepID=UPI003C75FE6B